MRPLAFARRGKLDTVSQRATSDAGNHYYATVSDAGIVSLSAPSAECSRPWHRPPVTITLNRPYRLRLESIGTRHRVYMNGVPVLDADDDGARERSRRAAHASVVGGVRQRSRRARRPRRFCTPQDFTSSGGPTDLWSFTGTGSLETRVASGSNFVFAQSSVAGTARAVIGVPTDDQSVDVRARPRLSPAQVVAIDGSASWRAMSMMRTITT